MAQSPYNPWAAYPQYQYPQQSPAQVANSPPPPGKVGAPQDGTTTLVKRLVREKLIRDWSIIGVVFLVIVLVAVVAFAAYALSPRSSGVNKFTPFTDAELAAVAGGGTGGGGGGGGTGGGTVTCPTSWTVATDVNKCYKFNTNLLNVADALVACTTDQATSHLVSVKTAAQNAALEVIHLANSAAVTACDIGYWSSGRRPTGSTNIDEFIWEDGTSVVYTNWATGKPDTQAAECILIKGEEGFPWQDRACKSGAKRCSICEL